MYHKETRRDKTLYKGVMIKISEPEFKREYIKQMLAEEHVAFTRSPMMISAVDWLESGSIQEDVKVNSDLKILTSRF